MPVIRTFISKVKPGRMQDAVTQLATFNRLFRESGATHFTAYHILTGPHFPGLSIHGVFENYAAFGTAREHLVQHPEAGGAAFAADAPAEIVRALMVEPVYRAGGDDVGSILAQTQVRFTLSVRPHKGRADDVVHRASRLADTIHQSGALGASVQRVIAGTDGPRIWLHSFHAGFAAFEATRNAVLESAVWTALSRSQDDSATRVLNVLCTKIAF
jgi:hypothetical protein